MSLYGDYVHEALYHQWESEFETRAARRRADGEHSTRTNRFGPRRGGAVGAR